MNADRLVSDRAARLAPSLTMALAQRVKELRAQGADIISLDIGEPDFDTPINVKAAAKKAIDEGFTKYTAESGMPELRKAVAEKFRRENGIECAMEQVVVSNGAKHSLTTAFLATLNPGDEVVIPSPYWVSYAEQVKLCDAVPVIAGCAQDWQLDLGAIRRAITPKTRMVMVNSPNNPSGAVYPEKDLRALAGIALESGCLILSDEIYEHIVFPPHRHFSIASISDEVRASTITISGASKTYAMTGWRMGYCTAPPAIARAMSALQGQMTSGPNSIAQKAVLAALSEPQDSVRAMAAAYERRRDLAVGLLREISGIEVVVPGGAFYVFPKVTSLYQGKAADSSSFCQFLLDSAKVSLIPGAAFGRDDCIRISTANSEANIEEGIRRMRRALDAL